MHFKWLRKLLCQDAPVTLDSQQTPILSFSEAFQPSSPLGGIEMRPRKGVHFGAPNSIIQISRHNSYLMTPPNRNYSDHKSSKTKPIHFNTRISNDCFCGREEDLGTIHTLVEETKRAGELVTVLCPSYDFNRLGGIGTTETLRAYVQRHSKKYKHIIWIDAENSITIKNCFMRLAENKLKMYLLDDNGKYLNFSKILQDIYDYLCKDSTLILFDNTKSLELQDQTYSSMQNFLPLNLNPKCVTPVVLIASKNPNWKNQRVFLLEPLSNETCIEILCRKLNLESNDDSNYYDALNLVEICGKLPLGLDLAVSVIRSIENYTMMDFLELYEEGSLKYLKHRPVNSSVEPAIFVMTNIIFGQIIRHNQGQLALKIMEYLAYLSPVIIPKELILSMFPKSSEGTMNKALNILNKYALIIDRKTYVQVHCMIQQATMETLRANDLEVGALRNAVQAIKNYVQVKEPGSGSCFREGLTCAVHLENSLKTYAVPEYYSFAKFVASKLEDIHFEESYELFSKILVFEKETLPTYHPSILETQNHIGTVLRNLNKFEESLELYLEIFEQSSDALGLDHPLSLSIKHNIATILAKQDMDSDAIELFSEVLERRKKLLGSYNTETLDTQSNMAAVLKKQGERQRAIELYSEASQGRARILGHDHPDTLRTQNELAATLFVQGSTEEAALIHAQVLEVAKRSFGINHPLTLMTQGHLAAAFFMQGKYEEAIELFSAILNSQKTIRTFDDSTVLTVQNNMAMACVKVGKNVEALELYSEALFIATDKLGTDHPLVIATESNLASLHFKMGEMHAALMMYSDVLERRRETLGLDHPLTKATQIKITSVLENMARIGRPPPFAIDID